MFVTHVCFFFPTELEMTKNKKIYDLSIELDCVCFNRIKSCPVAVQSEIDPGPFPIVAMLSSNPYQYHTDYRRKI